MFYELEDDEDDTCPMCGSDDIRQLDDYRDGEQQYRCQDCGATFPLE